MNNIKKMIVGFAAVALIIGGSAFKSESKKTKLVDWYYTLNSTGDIYTRVGQTEPDGGQCLSGPSKKCYLAFASDEGPTIDATIALPSPTVDESSSNGYQP